MANALSKLLNTTGPERTAWLERQLEPVKNALASAAYYVPPELRQRGAGVANLLAEISPGVDFRDMVNGSAEMMNARTPGEAAKGGANMLIGMAGQAPGFGDAFALAAKGALPAIFAGVGAKTMDAAKYARAEDMHRAGASRDDIWNETGWFKGADGKWKFEIDDSAARLNMRAIPQEGANIGPAAFSRIMEVTGLNAEDALAAMRADKKLAVDAMEWARGNAPKPSVPASSALSHNALYDAYPDAAGVKMTQGDFGQTAGYFARDPNEIGISNGLLATNPRSTSLHEMQHVVQGKEGFAVGGSMSDIGPTPEVVRMGQKQLADLYRADPGLQQIVLSREKEQARLAAAYGPNWIDAAPASEIAQKSALDEAIFEHPKFDQWDSLTSMTQATPRDGYRHLAGEVEARNVQARQNMNASQRQATPPWQTQDVPDDSQVLRFWGQDGGTAASMAMTPAQEVAGMLKAGRGADITDEMIAKADPAELFDLYGAGKTGMDMPMDEASRMARAQGMGFDTGTPLYHGTGADFQAFNPANRGSVADAVSARAADWMTDSPTTAKGYADMAGIDAPVARMVRESEAAGARGDWDAADRIMAEAERLEASMTRDAGQSILPVMSPRPALSVDAGGSSVTDMEWSMRDAIKSAKRSGGSGVEFRNFNDHPDYSVDDPALHRGIFDPTNIRSRFARFDPRLKHLANLSAAGAGVIGYNALRDDRDRNEQGGM